MAMKTLYYPAFGRLELAERPEPRLAAGEVMVEVAACGICGSELESFGQQSTKRTPPIIMGHEFCGTIVAMGEGVTGWALGDRVVSNAIVGCGKCAACAREEINLCRGRQVFSIHRNGAFTERVNVPAGSLLDWPDELSAAQACMAEPLANGVHMVSLSSHLPVRNVLVFGAGPIGILAMQAFRALRGARCIVADINGERLQVAGRLGAELLANPKTDDLAALVAGFTGGEGVDIVVDAVGLEQTTGQGLELLRPGGAMLLIGLGKDARALSNYGLILPQKQVIGSYGSTQQDMQVAIDLMVQGKVDVESWVDHYPLSEGVEAFMDMLSAKNIKSVIRIKG